MKVMKFGGTSVGKPERMHEVAKLITIGSGKENCRFKCPERNNQCPGGNWSVCRPF